MSGLTRDGTAEPVSRDQILRHAGGEGNINFPCSADHEQDLQPYPVDPYSAIYVMTRYIYIYIHIHTYIHTYYIKRRILRSDTHLPCQRAERILHGRETDRDLRST